MLTTPNKGIRYPLLTDAGDVNQVAATIFDLDTVATAEDTLRATALHQRGAIITNSTSPSITKGTATKFTFDTVLVDTNGLTNLGTNNDRFTITTAGLYLFGCVIVCNSAGTLGFTNMEVSACRNTTAGPAVPNIRRKKNPGPAFGAGAAGCSMAAPYFMAASDFCTMWTFWNGTAAGPATYNAPLFWVLPVAIS